MLKPPTSTIFLICQIAIVICWTTATTGSLALAQFVESFDGKSPAWQRHDSDCVIEPRSWLQKRQRLDNLSYEEVRFESGPGSHVYISHPITPTFIIPELNPAIRIKSDRPGVKLLVRMVLPHTPAPSGDGPMTTTLAGPQYDTPGQWQTLDFSGDEFQLTELLKKELWYLKRTYGPQVTAREAFIDRVVLNAYTGSGQNHVLVDDIRVDGLVAVKNADQLSSNFATVYQDSSVQQASGIVDTEKRPSLVRRDSTVLIVEKRPFFPLIIEHNGEGFDFLKELGFNTVEMQTTATLDQLEEAKKMDMWVVCPPPPSAGVSEIGFAYDRVLAWSVGRDLQGRDVRTVQQRVREIRESDLRENRPIVANAKSSWSRISPHVDILSTGLQPLGTSLLASQYSDWLQQVSQSVATSKPLWADIQTELAQPLIDQVSTIARQTPPTPIEPQQLKFLVGEAITGGARGLRFRSRNRLDAADPATRLRTLTIELTNAFIEQIRPWAVGGVRMGEVPSGDRSVEITAFNTNRSRLLLIQRPTHHEQYWAGDVPLKSITLIDNGSTFTNRAYQLTDTRLKLLPSTRKLGGTEVQIADCPFMTAVVLTQDPTVISQLAKSYRRPGKQSIQEMRSELSQQWIAIMQLIDKQMGKMGRSSAAVAGAINEAVTAYRIASDLMVKNSGDSATKFLDQTDERLGFSRRETAVGPLGLFQSKTSTPFVTHASLIPLHWQLTNRLKNAGAWNPNGLPGGDFESLQHMQRSGWENHRADSDRVLTRVELTPEQAVLGRKSLKLTVTPNPSSATVEETPLWIVSPPVKVKPSQIVQIHGWVNVPQSIRGGGLDGLKITDSLAGEPLAERINRTNGWEEFTLYRSADQAGDLRVRFDLTGFGTAYVDEVTIRTIDF